MSTTDYHRDYQRRVLGKGWDLDEVLAHLSMLDESGVNLLRVSEVTGLDYSGLVRLRRKACRVSRRSALAILAVRPEDAAPTGVVPIERLEAVLAELERRGWTRAQVATEIGWAHAPQTDRPGRRGVRLATLWKVQALLDLPPRRGGRVLTEAEQAQMRREVERVETQRAEWRERKQASRGVSRLTATPVLPTDWYDHAACADKPRHWWFSEGNRATTERALAVCASCPVSADCAAHAEATRSYGVWGGTVYVAGVRQQDRPKRRRTA